jgi:hypothetical protein
MPCVPLFAADLELWGRRTEVEPWFLSETGVLVVNSGSAPAATGSACSDWGKTPQFDSKAIRKPSASLTLKLWRNRLAKLGIDPNPGNCFGGCMGGCVGGLKGGCVGGCVGGIVGG